jgi:hypothetical protein
MENSIACLINEPLLRQGEEVEEEARQAQGPQGPAPAPALMRGRA